MVKEIVILLISVQIIDIFICYSRNFDYCRDKRTKVKREQQTAAAHLLTKYMQDCMTNTMCACGRTSEDANLSEEYSP